MRNESGISCQSYDSIIFVLERTSAEARILARSFDDQRHNFVFCDFIWIKDIHQFSIFKNCDSITEIENIVNIMADEEDPNILLFQLVGQVPHSFCLLYTSDAADEP